MRPFIHRTAPGLAVVGLLFAGPVKSADHVPAVQWRTDYNSARKEAHEKGLLILLSIGSEDCLFCKKQDATTFKDAGIVKLLNSQFIPVKIDGNQEIAFVQALKATLFPTTVLAGPDGRILGFLQGFVAADALQDHARRAILNVTTPDWVARDLKEANKAIGGQDYTRAVTLLKGIVADAEESPARTKAEQVLAEVEKGAADRMAHAKELESKGESTAAADVLAELVRDYAGTSAARDAANRLVGVAAKTDSRPRTAIARELLASAREDFRDKRYADCLDKCDRLALRFPELPESKDASTLALLIKDDPDRLSAACEQMNERTAAMYLTLAEAWQRKGQLKEAYSCLEKVSRVNPNGKSAELAQVKLANWPKNGVPAITVGFEKK